MSTATPAHFTTTAREALEACRVFTTPLERLRDWNEFKEDAARRVNAALAALQDPANDPEQLRAGYEMVKADAARWVAERDEARAQLAAANARLATIDTLLAEELPKEADALTRAEIAEAEVRRLRAGQEQLKQAAKRWLDERDEARAQLAEFHAFVLVVHVTMPTPESTRLLERSRATILSLLQDTPASTS